MCNLWIEIKEAPSGYDFIQIAHRSSFALLWSGQQLSALGDSIYRVALAWWVLEKTGSAKAMSTIFIFASTPMLVFLLIGGVAVDRYSRARVMFLSDILRGLLIGIVALLAFAHRLEIWHIYIVSLLFGIVGRFRAGLQGHPS